jgi:uncharacterized protein YjbJ (UPF0337 family)
MNAEQFKGSWTELKRALKEWEKLTAEDLTQIDGDQVRFAEAVQKRYGELKSEEITKWADRWYAKWSGWYEGYQEAKPAPPGPSQA